MTTSNTGPLIPRRRLGVAFRQLREAQGETLQQTSKALMFSPSKLSRIENGGAGDPHPRDVRDLIAHFGLTGSTEAERLEELAKEGRVPGWWQVPPYRMPADLDTFIAYESAASRIEHYSPTVIPGLLQTRAYAMETLRRLVPHLSEPEVSHQADIRMERQRQRRSAQNDRPTTQWYVIPETVLRRQVGTPETMREQLTSLAKAVDDPLVEFHVIPFSAGLYEAAELPAITIFRYPAPDSAVVVIERIRYVEFLDRPNTVQKYTDILNRLPNYWLDQEQSSEYIKRLQQEKWQEAR